MFCQSVEFSSFATAFLGLCAGLWKMVGETVSPFNVDFWQRLKKNIVIFSYDIYCVQVCVVYC